MNNTNTVPRPKFVNTSPHIYKDNLTIFVISKPSTKPSTKYQNVYINDINEHYFSTKSGSSQDPPQAQAQAQAQGEPSLILLKNPENPKTSQNNYNLILANEYIIQENQLYRNSVILNKIHEHFRMFELPWNNSLEDVLAIYAIICNINRIFTDFEPNLNNISPDRQRILDEFSIKFSSNPVEEECWLFTQFYKPKEKARFEEICQTLSNNINNPLLSKIVLFFENENDIEYCNNKYPNNNRIICVKLNKRLSYTDFLKYVVSDQVPTNTFVVLANSDIYFDNTLRYLWKISLNDKCLALLRWEHSDKGLNDAKLFGPRPDSQDTWIFNSNCIKSRAATKWNDDTYIQFNYYLGTPGCDNSFTTDMIRERFTVVNPAGTIKTYHIHGSQVRSYTNKDLVYRPVYFSITPSLILEKNYIKSFPMKPIVEAPYSATIKIKSNADSRATTFVNMLARSNRYKWLPPPHENIINEKFNIYKITGINYVSSQGIVYNNNKIFLGDMKSNTEYINNMYLNLFGQFIKVNRFLAIPIKSIAIFKNKYTFIFNYVLPLIRCIHELYTAGITGQLTTFFPKQYLDIANMINLPIKLEIIPYDNNINIYSEEIYMIQAGYIEPSQECIDCFRKSLNTGNPLQSSPEKRLVYLAQGNILSLEFAEILKDRLSKMGWDLDIYDASSSPSHKIFEDAGGVIFWGEPNSPSRWEMLWALPKGAAMLEFQNEFKLDGEAQAMGAACNLDTRIYILQKAEPQFLQSKIESYIIEYLDKKTA